jgi:2-(1,2-epoxy-1,2-dihydrophenyl)acetyl-CoA isomerase
MPYEALTLDIHEHVATLTLNRPDAYNALNAQMAAELLDATTQVDEDPQVRCLVITGAGKAFCAGGDVKVFHDHLPQIGTHLKQLTGLLHGAVSRIARMPKPVIAAVNGVVAGGGMGLMLACDLSYAVETATLTMAYTRIGANPDGSSTFWLPRLVGVRRALELIYSNRVLTAQEAHAWGILNGVMPPDKFRRSIQWRDSWQAARPWPTPVPSNSAIAASTKPLKRRWSMRHATSPTVVRPRTSVPASWRLWRSAPQIFRGAKSGLQVTVSSSRSQVRNWAMMAS